MGILFGSIITVVLYVLSKQGIYVEPVDLVLTQICALLGAFLLSVNFILASRFPGIERWFGGLDRVYKQHHIVGALAYGLIIQHLIWLIIGSLPNSSQLLVYLLPQLSNMPYGLGILAFWVLSALLILTMFVKLPYHVWHGTHQWFGVVALLGLLHVFLITSDVSRYLPLRIWMLAWLLLGLVASIYKRFLYRLIGPQAVYVIDSLRKTNDLITLGLMPQTNKIIFSPGQFVFMETPLNREHHPFSIASSSENSQLMIVAKEAGDYTSMLRSLKQGDVVRLFGPYGQFFSQLKPSSKIVGVAGGIGITPFLSLIQTWRQNPDYISEMYLIHSVSAGSQALEIEPLPHFSYIPHLSRLSGRLSGEALVSFTTNGFEPDLYLLCGPIPMMVSLKNQLMALGVAKKKIIFEDFSLK